MNHSLAPLSLVLPLALACTANAPSVRTEFEPLPSEGAECAVCGMVVDEQPAPRGQLARADGSHEFYCSVGDLRAGVAAPSPHGGARAIWVEPGETPGEHHPVTTWLPAEGLTYVVGFPNPGVMGRAALAFRNAERATAAAASLGGWTTTWADLRATPFTQDPPRTP